VTADERTRNDGIWSKDGGERLGWSLGIDAWDWIHMDRRIWIVEKSTWKKCKYNNKAHNKWENNFYYSMEKNWFSMNWENWKNQSPKKKFTYWISNVYPVAMLNMKKRYWIECILLMINDGKHLEILVISYKMG
jgi:hypothetical protein